MKILLIASLGIILSFNFLAANANPCGTDGWQLYLDEKCFKVFDGLANYTVAEATCAAQSGRAQLLSIGSPEEQSFLETFLFISQKAVDNVWLSARGQNDAFRWNDGTSLSYSNWLIGSPRHAHDACVQMNSEDDMKSTWAVVSCSKKNLVVCQKTPTLSLFEVKEILFALRKELQTTTKKLHESACAGNQLQARVSLLESQPQVALFPLGFTYVQLPKEKAPGQLWPSMTWTEVSSAYSGVFFRVAGGEAGQFGAIQEASTPRLDGAEWNECQSHQRDKCRNFNEQAPLRIRNDDEWSAYVKTANSYVAFIDGVDESRLTRFKNFIRFHYSASEVRPRNMAVKVWKRTA